MGCAWGQDEHPIMKMVDEEVEIIVDGVKGLKEARKSGSAKEDVGIREVHR